MSTPRKYKAFISYSHADKAWASRLHLRLETFRTPKKIIGGAGRYGDIPSKLTPIFRDRDELPTGSALGPELKRALTNSEFLLVLCSPASANSRWVNEEIRFFRQTHGDDRILAAIVDGEPGAPVGEGLDGCFPPALIEPPEGSDQPREPLAADFRESADGKKLAFQKLAAGMLGAHLDALVQRMAQRRQKRMAQLAGALGTLSLFMGGLAIYATFQRDAAIEQRAIAERERDTANASLDFLISIFEVANPETENPKNITALTILDRGREKIDEELADQPEAQAKILTAMGNVYGNLSELDTAETLFRSALEKDKIAIIDKIENEISLAYLLADTKSSSEALTFIQSAKALIQNAKAQGSISADASSYAEGQLLEAEARVARSLGKTQLAIALYDQARSKLIESSRTKPRELAVVAIRRGTLMASRTDDLKGAQAELASAIEIFRDHLGEDHIETLRAKHNLAFMQFNSELYDLA
ncbi:MAG: TIR domain-containing protein, partial [Pseudomonadota bacterium]